MIHQVFSLDIPHGNYSAHYDVNTRYFGVTKDATMGLELSTTQFEVCQQANGQFCHISTPFQPLANPPTCITALYAKSETSIKSRCSLQLHKASSTSLPTQTTPDAWILVTPTSAPTDTISLICLENLWKLSQSDSQCMYLSYQWPAVPLHLTFTYHLGMNHLS